MLEPDAQRAEDPPADEPGGAAHAAADRPRFRVLRVSDLARLPKRADLIDGILPAHASGVLYAPSGAGKTFLALDWALTVASPEVDTWMGRRVLRHGPVVYVAAEGHAGLADRVAAWSQARGVRREPDLLTVLEPVQLLEPTDIGALLDALDPHLPDFPRLIILDTLNRSMVGGDENSTSDMTLLTAGQDLLRRASQATVLLLHHSMKHAELERGNSALRAAQDFMLRLDADDDVLTLESTKMRDGAPVAPIRLRLAQAGKSCVVEDAEAATAQPARVTKNERHALEVLDQISLSDGAPCSAWLSSTGGKTRTFYRSRRGLIAKGLVAKVGRGYTVSPEGRAFLLPTASQLPRHCHDTPPAAAATLPPLKGWGSDGSRAAAANGSDQGDAWEPEHPA